MLASLRSYEPVGFEGEIVRVEVDIRRGLPGVDLVGLPDNAVREAKERVRVAIRNSGYKFPADRILINLAPAGLKKEGASYDLPIAVGILLAANELRFNPNSRVMVLGELNLTGSVKPVKGVLGALIAGKRHGITNFLVPRGNFREALSLNYGNIFPVESLNELNGIFESVRNGRAHLESKNYTFHGERGLYYKERVRGDFSDIKGQDVLKRALEIAAAGFHNVLIVGPPGSGKTLSVTRFPSILPELTREESLEVTRLHSIAGVLPPDSGLVRYRPIRVPHHTASIEGVMGGGKSPGPGEVSLAHRGVLFLDEALEFKKSVLQGLREPIESGRINVSRVGSKIQFPADFQLIMTANACPCGNLGKGNGMCVCSVSEIHRYWRKLGEAMMDRMDIRVPVTPMKIEGIISNEGESSKVIAMRVKDAVNIQEERYKNYGFSRNSRIKAGLIEKFCKLDTTSIRLLVKALSKLSLSSRAHHSILKIARTIADLAGSDRIREEHLLEAIQHRRFESSGFMHFFN